MAVEVMELAVQAVTLGNVNTISDGASGGALARAALSGASYNVRINIAGLSEPAIGAPLLGELRLLEQRAEAAEKTIRSALLERAGLPLP
jgi:formiminotetrahydrofolate cyclodeaminase